ncbi:MAG TPA: ferritin-like domain-containing protein [Hyphomicrobiaceae bacterium]|jgi:ferritin-like metal-binding protein YciE
MTDVREVFVSGLRDAYAMEKQAKDMMESQASRLEDYPEMQSRAAQHARETDAQIDRLRQCLEMIGESPSMFKEFGTRAMANLQSMLSAASTDEPIKETLTGFAFENFEIASYRSLIAFAKQLGEQRMVPLLEESLREEERMANWVGDHIESITEQFASRASATA